MTIATAISLILATAVLVAIPGPNVVLIVARSLRFGLRQGIVTVLGTTTGMALQMLIVVAGLAAVLNWFAGAFSILRWLGVAYLLFYAMQLWRRADDLTGVEEVAVDRQSFLQGFVVALLNPKALIFSAAFIPQFLGAAGHATDIVLVAAIYVFVLLIGDLLWALFASFARGWLQRYATLQRRISAALIAAAGIGLALAGGHNQLEPN